ncbi:MAG: glycosyl hydrolase 53 family protein [Bacteroidaceae bacterium]|nr:glycosyl hydrolase 53 family protein [Bacteroidaceae bacterium]
MLIGATTMSGMAQNAINLGGDISMLPEYERVSTPYYTSAGKKIPDVLTYMKETCKMNSMRVRLFVTPNKSEDPQLAQDLAYVQKLGKRIKDAGLDFMLDFHYSDTWADPSNQTIPSTWKTNTSNTALTDSMYSYTKRCLEYLKENGATPDFVQVGNEVSYGMLWRNYQDRCYDETATTWKRFTDFLSAGAKAVREVTPDAKIIIHVERTSNANNCANFFNKMKANSVDYDIIGLSYYPFWHKDLASLSKTLSTLETQFPDKPVQIVETAYYYQNFPTGDAGYDDTTGTWPDTAAGQQAFIEDLCTELGKHDNVTGLYYWFPEENGSGGATWNANNVVLNKWINRGLWNNDTHKINSAILKLQNFLTEKEALSVNSVKVSDGADADTSIYNMNGQRVNEMSAPGIYLKGGKKYMIR